jgi:hypothetical protein
MLGTCAPWVGLSIFYSQNMETLLLDNRLINNILRASCDSAVQFSSDTLRDKLYGVYISCLTC